ncbi:sorting nexin-15-like isoform X1 [Hypanus sabinus]|uniref:sorting nexin-15-like isoform X1 n=1 Tax=Hypanus sabinus TaxID=79690 RepID=UPI0028C3DD23|nr:sorting nexin-15-like isoform X1 [Hypanus sabinus]
MACHRGRAERCEYRVSEPRLHPHGFTEYRVTARIISKKTAEVKEVTVFKRYSDFKKLHSELSYIHRNLFRKLEEFPPFPKAQVFGRFDAAVIEDRRRCAEELLQFTVDIPALSNSPQLRDFFKGGEACWPLELSTLKEASALPEPLIPLPTGLGRLPESGMRTEALATVEVDGGEPDAGWAEEDDAHSLTDVGKEADGDEGPLQDGSSLPDSELALFDPCAKEEAAPACARQSNLEALSVPSGRAEEPTDPEDLEARLLTLRVSSPDSEHPLGTDELEGTDYLSAAAACIKQALEREAAQEYEAALNCYRSGVAILLKGLQGEPSAERQDAIKKRVAEYLNHAEAIFTVHLEDMVAKDATPPS